MIVFTKAGVFEAASRGCQYSLLKSGDGWVVFTRRTDSENAKSVPFDSLDEVESSYKVYRGISLLVNSFNNRSSREYYH